MLAAFGLSAVAIVVCAAVGWVDAGRWDPFAVAAAPSSPSPVAAAPALAEPETSPAEEEPTTRPGYEDRGIFLSAADAIATGPKVKVEPRLPMSAAATQRAAAPPKRGSAAAANRLPDVVVRGWSSPADSAEWTFAIPRAGRYAITFDCTGSTGGAAIGTFKVEAAGESITATVDTERAGRKGRGAYQLIDVGSLSLPAGEVTLVVRPTETKRGFMALRSVRIYPTE